MMVTCLVLALITLVGTIGSSSALSKGAPESSCTSLLPSHGTSKPQQSSSPYIVMAKPLDDNKVEVLIKSPTVDDKFKGFILQARDANNPDTLVTGTFKEDGRSQAICEGSTLTHVENVPKTDVSTVWTSNALYNGGVIFRATVVKDWPTYWTNIDSNPIEIENELRCGELEDCPEMPEKCVEDNQCKVLLQFNSSNSGVTFSLSGKLQKWQYMAMAISKDNVMGSDFVTECIRVDTVGDEPEVMLRKSWNEGKSNMNTTILQSASYTYVDGITTCVWKEQKVLSYIGHTFDLSTKPYILLAHGDVNEANLALEYHEERTHSPERVELFPSGYLTLVTSGDSTKTMTDEPNTTVTDKEMHKQSTADHTTENYSTDPTSGTSTLNFSVFTIGLFGFLYVSQRNILNQI